MKDIVNLSGVYFIREGREILHDINYSVNKGGFIVITGPNGGGKTTLLKLICGLVQPSKGCVSCSANSIGYLPQKNSIDSHFPITVEEVIDSGLLTLPFSKKEKIALRDEAISMLNLQDLRCRAIGKLSGGQLQRTLIARALVRKSDLLILDEPTSYLDRDSETLLLSILQDQKEKGTTILMVTHRSDTISSPADRIIYIDKTLTFA